MIVDFSEISTDENWEFFARDFLVQLGFVVDIGPGRGADAGKDLIVSEQRVGRFSTKRVCWLVSCKYFTRSNKSVGVSDEQSILDRIRHHKADGFIGFYSTVASSSLIDRLHQLVIENHIDNYEILDVQKITAKFFDAGMSKIAFRYFPKSYPKLRPIQSYLSEYVPLVCEICGIDILHKSMEKSYSANIVLVVPRGKNYQRKSAMFLLLAKERAMRKSRSGF